MIRSQLESSYDHDHTSGPSHSLPDSCNGHSLAGLNWAPGGGLEFQAQNYRDSLRLQVAVPRFNLKFWQCQLENMMVTVKVAPGTIPGRPRRGCRRPPAARRSHIYGSKFYLKFATQLGNLNNHDNLSRNIFSDSEACRNLLRQDAVARRRHPVARRRCRRPATASSL